MLEVHLLCLNQRISHSVQLQRMDEREKGDAQEVGGGQQGKAQDDQAADELMKGDPGSARLHSSHAGGQESPEKETQNREQEKKRDETWRLDKDRLEGYE